MDSDTILKKRLLDIANKSYNTNTYTYTNFLSLQELDLYYSMLSELNFVKSFSFGGNECSERQIVQFGSEEELGYAGEFPITLIKISPLIDKFSDDLNHRDFLGAILNLGIERNVLGDIIIKGNTGYLYCIDSISDFIIDNLTKIKHTHVSCTKVSGDVEDVKPTLEDVSLIVASKRIDVVVAGLIKLSRSKVLELFRTKKIFINGKGTENNSTQLQDNDILVIRGYGKYIFQSVGNETRKGRIYIHLKKYV